MHTKKKPKAIFEIAECHKKGSRPTMEDATSIIHQFANIPNSIFVGVYDGHNGSKCSNFLAENISDEIERRKSTEVTLKTLEDAYVAVDDAWLTMARKENIKDGSTALCMVLLNDSIYIANTGDSRAVMSQGKQLIVLTHDHKPELDEEKK